MNLNSESTLHDLKEIVDYLLENHPKDTPISLCSDGGEYPNLSVLEVDESDEQNKSKMSICFYVD